MMLGASRSINMYVLVRQWVMSG